MSEDQAAHKPSAGTAHEQALRLCVLEKLADVVLPDVSRAFIGEGEDDSEMYSPSPVSTVSSSGEVGGVYTLYSDALPSEEEQDLSCMFQNT